MVDNFEMIKAQLVESGSTKHFYHLQILRRGKDHPDLPAANKLIKSWLVHGPEHLESLKEEIIFLCEHYKARAYINIAPKSIRRLNTLILSKLAENIHNNNIINPWHIYHSACGELKPESKCWIVDVDTKDRETLHDIEYAIDEVWLSAHPLDGGMERSKCWWICELPTMNGYHLITRPFNLHKFKQKYPDVDVHKNNPTALYVPNSIIPKI